jgi:hypothetical protein
MTNEFKEFDIFWKIFFFGRSPALFLLFRHRLLKGKMVYVASHGTNFCNHAGHSY